MAHTQITMHFQRVELLSRPSNHRIKLHRRTYPLSQVLCSPLKTKANANVKATLHLPCVSSSGILSLADCNYANDGIICGPHCHVYCSTSTFTTLMNPRLTGVSQLICDLTCGQAMHADLDKGKTNDGVRLSLMFGCSVTRKTTTTTMVCTWNLDGMQYSPRILNFQSASQSKSNSR